MSADSWGRLLWGVKFVAADGYSMLLGCAWLTPMPPGAHPDEPTRALLFTTRSAAREWCRKKMREYKGRTDVTGGWRFRPVRVRERVSER